jgi:hypothetical protein
MLAISPEDAASLPVDELAMLVLRDLATWHEANEYNYGNSLRQDTARGLRPIRARARSLRAYFRWSGPDSATASGAVSAGCPKWAPKLAALLAYQQVKPLGERSVRPSARVTRPVGRRTVVAHGGLSHGGCVAELSRSLGQGGACGAASGAPRAGLCLGRPARRARAVPADDSIDQWPWPAEVGVSASLARD